MTGPVHRIEQVRCPQGSPYSASTLVRIDRHGKARLIDRIAYKSGLIEYKITVTGCEAFGIARADWKTHGKALWQRLAKEVTA